MPRAPCLVPSQKKDRSARWAAERRYASAPAQCRGRGCDLCSLSCLPRGDTPLSRGRRQRPSGADAEDPAQPRSRREAVHSRSEGVTDQTRDDGVTSVHAAETSHRRADVRFRGYGDHAQTRTLRGLVLTLGRRRLCFRRERPPAVYTNRKWLQDKNNGSRRRLPVSLDLSGGTCESGKSTASGGFPNSRHGPAGASANERSRDRGCVAARGLSWSPFTTGVAYRSTRAGPRPRGVPGAPGAPGRALSPSSSAGPRW